MWVVTGIATDCKLVDGNQETQQEQVDSIWRDWEWAEEMGTAVVE